MVMSSAKPHKKFLILDDGIKIPQAQVNPTSEKTDHQDSPAIGACISLAPTACEPL